MVLTGQSTPPAGFSKLLWSSGSQQKSEELFMDPKKNPDIVERVCKAKMQNKQSREAWKRGLIAFILALVLAFDMWYSCFLRWYPWHQVVFISELFIAFLFFQDAVAHLVRFAFPTLGRPTIYLTKRQQQLLKVDDNEPGFCIQTPGQPSTPANSATTSPSIDVSPVKLSPSSSSLRSFSDGSPSTLLSTSWAYFHNTPSPSRQDSSFVSALDGSQDGMSSHPSSPKELIRNEQELKNYLSKFEQQEKRNASFQFETPSSPEYGGSFLTPSPSRSSLLDFTGFLRRFSYQPANTMLVQTPGRSDKTSPKSGSKQLGDEVWRLQGISPSSLIRWSQNLRSWLSDTVLSRLMSEIDSVNASLEGLGLGELCIGTTALERLKKAAITPLVLHAAPTLPDLIPFLEATSNQQYLVSRLRELSRGGCLGEFRWKDGGNFQGRPWESHLPTDSELLFHFFATYLDSQLPPSLHLTDGRPFSSKFIIRPPEVPKKPAPPDAIMIQEVDTKPPHLVVLVGDETLSPGQGLNNFFHAILLFLLIVNTRMHGMLGRVSLGPSGVNMLWIMEK